MKIRTKIEAISLVSLLVIISFSSAWAVTRNIQSNKETISGGTYYYSGSYDFINNSHFNLSNKIYNSRGHVWNASSPNIQLALNDLTAGGTVYVSSGIFSISTALTITNNDIRIIGQGINNTKLIIANSKNINIFNITDINNIVIKDMTLDCNKDGTVYAATNYSQMAIYSIINTDHQGLFLQNLCIQNCWSKGICIRANLVTCIYRNITIDNIDFYHIWHDKALTTCWSNGGFDGISISNIDMDNVSTGITIDSRGGVLCPLARHVTINNVRLKNIPNNWGVALIGVKFFSISNVICDNVGSLNWGGIVCSSNTSNGSITGCVINNSVTGIRVDSSRSDIIFMPPGDITITGCVVSNCTYGVGIANTKRISLSGITSNKCLTNGIILSRSSECTLSSAVSVGAADGISVSNASWINVDTVICKNNTYSIVLSAKSSNISVNNANLRASQYGIYAWNINDSRISNIKTYGCYNAIYINQCNRSTFSGIENRYYSNVGIYLNIAKNITLSNVLNSFGRVSGTKGIYGGTVSNITITDASCFNNTFGIYFSTSAKNIYVNGASIRNSTYGIYNSGINVIILNAFSSYALLRGIYCDVNTRNVTIMDSQFNSNVDGIYISGKNNTIHNCVLLDNSNSGVLLSASSRNNTVYFCKFKGGAYTVRMTGDSTNSRINYNFGYVTENKGNTSVVNNGTISHGLGAAPTVVVVTTFNVNLTAHVTMMSSTTFKVCLIDIHTGSPPGGSWPVYWEAKV